MTQYPLAASGQPTLARPGPLPAAARSDLGLIGKRTSVHHTHSLAPSAADPLPTPDSLSGDLRCRPGWSARTVQTVVPHQQPQRRHQHALGLLLPHRPAAPALPQRPLPHRPATAQHMPGAGAGRAVVAATASSVRCMRSQPATCDQPSPYRSNLTNGIGTTRTSFNLGGCFGCGGTRCRGRRWSSRLPAGRKRSCRTPRGPDRGLRRRRGS